MIENYSIVTKQCTTSSITLTLETTTITQDENIFTKKLSTRFSSRDCNSSEYKIRILKGMDKAHKICSICGRRIPSNEKKRKLGTPCLWEKALKYATNEKILITTNMLICRTCNCNIMLNNTKGIKPVGDKRRGLHNTLNDGASTTYTDSENSQFGESQLESMEELSSTASSTSVSMEVSSSATIESSNENAKQSLQIEISSCLGTEKKCFVCYANERSRVPKAAIAQIWYEKNIIVPLNNRCCKDHLKDGLFKTSEIQKIVSTKSSSVFTATDIKDFLTTITNYKVLQNRSSVVNFNESSLLTDRDYKKLTGISKENFNDLHSVCVPHLKNSSNRSTRNALGIFLLKLRLNLSQEVLAIFFGIKEQSKISDTITAVTKILDEHFVPNHLGYAHLTRTEAMKHQTQFIKTLFNTGDDVLSVIADATYLYLQKPSDQDLQKKLYCMHKHDHLAKPMMLSLSDGYLVDCDGLWFSDNNNNDAKILSKILDNPNGFRTLFRCNDIVIVDRGFRDVIPKLQSMNFKTYMPDIIKKSEKQFSVLKANHTRQVTMQRWIIESVNGRVKNLFRFLDSRIPITYLPKLNSLCRIGASIINAYSPPLFTDNEESISLAEKAVQRLLNQNPLMEHIEEQKMERKQVCWKKLSKDDFEDFPKLNKKQLMNTTLGVYQLNLAKFYTRRHLREDPSYVIFGHKEQHGLIRAKIESRFSSGKIHQLWIRYKPNDITDEAIEAWYCKCQVGARVVGCCSHITSVLWFLAYARHDASLLEDRLGMADNILDASTVYADDEDLEVQDSQEEIDVVQ